MGRHQPGVGLFLEVLQDPGVGQEELLALLGQQPGQLVVEVGADGQLGGALQQLPGTKSRARARVSLHFVWRAP